MKGQLILRLGLRVDPLSDNAWLVQRPAVQQPVLDADRVDDGVWLVQPTGRPRKYRQRLLGRQEAMTRLLYNPAAARANAHQLQRKMGQFLLEEQVLWIFRDLGINCVLDVGANVGQYAMKLRRAGYKGRIDSFEPLPEFAEQLRRHATDDPAWYVHEYALGDENTTAVINATPGKALSSLLPASDFGREWSEELRDPVQESVTVRRLDSVLDDILQGLDDPRVFLKMDTQGYDLPTMYGAGSRLADIVGMQSEVACLPLYEEMHTMEQQLAEYRAAGFDIAGMYPVGRHKQTLRVVEFDVVMVRASAFRPAGTPA